MLRAFAAAAFSLALFFSHAPEATAQVRQVSQKTVGSWSVIGWKMEGAGYCSAERDVNEFRVAFVRTQQGYLLLVRSPSWNLQQGGVHPVSYKGPPGGQRTSNARVLTHNILAFEITTDPARMREIATAPTFEITAMDETITISMEDFDQTLVALDDCLGEVTQSTPQVRPGPQVQRPAAPSKPTGPRYTTPILPGGSVKKDFDTMQMRHRI